MSKETLHAIAIAMAIGRILIGLAPFVAAGPLTRLLGFPAAHDSPSARLMARFFGVRDIGLGILVAWAVRHAEVLLPAFYFNALMDLGDAISIAIPLVRRQGIDRAAIACGIFAVGGGSLWIIVAQVAR